MQKQQRVVVVRVDKPYMHARAVFDSFIDGDVEPGRISQQRIIACSVGWFIPLLVREEILLVDLCERKILF